MLKTVPQQEVAAYSVGGEGSGTVSAGATVRANHRDTETVVSLLDICVREQDKRRILYHRRILAAVLFSFLCPMITAYLSDWLYGYETSLTFMPALGAFNALTLLFFLGGQPPAQAQQLKAVRSLATIVPSDHRTLAVLLDTLPLLPARSWLTQDFDWPDYKSLFPIIATNLWHAGADLPLILNDDRRARLRGTLNALWNGNYDLESNETDFCASAIKALTLVGDKQSVKILTRIARSNLSRIKAGTLTTGENRLFLQSLAKDCLSLLAECDARNVADAKGFRELLHPRKAEIKTNDVDRFLLGIGEARTNWVIHEYLRKHAAETRPNWAVHPLILMGLTFLLLAAPLPLETKLISTVIPLLFAGSRAPILAESLGQAVRYLQFLANESKDRKRARILGYHASESNDPRLLLPLFEAMDRSNFEVLRRPLSKLLRNLVPGDVAYSNDRLLSFLRGIIRARIDPGNKSRYDATFTESAIYALGVLQDEKAHAVLSYLSQSEDPRHAHFLGATLDALRRINDARGLRGTARPNTRRSRRSVRR